MKCPYCISEIHLDATVCAVCRRDLYLFKPLLARIEELEAKLAALPVGQSESSTAENQIVAVDTLPSTSPIKEKPAILALFLWLTAPFLLLILGHWTMIFLYDVKVVYLRVFALLLPLPFGYLFASALRRNFAWGLIPAFLMAGLAVLGMSGITASIDHVPVLPQNIVEIREFIEFALSIGLSFTTGLWLHHWAKRHQERKAAVNGQKLAEKLSHLNDLGSGVVAFATTAFSIYTGLKGLIG